MKRKRWNVVMAEGVGEEDLVNQGKVNDNVTRVISVVPKLGTTEVV